MFRRFDPDRILLMPPSLDEWLPQDHLARFVAELVDEVLDLSAIYADYTEMRGFPPYDPRLMVRLLIYGYTTGVRSWRAIERKCVDDVAFRFLAADVAPDFRSIARFRRRHLDALAGLFLQSLRLAQRLGMVRMGRVALDGTKLRANASKHKAMSYARLVDKEQVVEAEVAELEAAVADLLADAEATDTAEDAQYGRDGKDVDLPAELDRREKRLARLQAARAQIEAEAAVKARAKAEAAQTRRQEAAGGADAEAVAAAGEQAAARAKPKPKAQANFTDPESRIMKTVTAPTSRHTTARPSSTTPTRSSPLPTSPTAPRTAPATPRCSTRPPPTPAATPDKPSSTPATALMTTCTPPQRGRPNTPPPRSWPPDGWATTNRCHPRPVGGSRTTPPSSNAWPAGCAPNPAGPPTPAAKPSSNPSSARS
jgi:transposase